MDANELRSLQMTLLEICCEVDRICREEGIPYFIIAGTALGAVRHGGFIPWDDDLDIGMKREDYERFLQAAPGKLKPEYFLQNHETDPNAPFYFTKIRKNGTRFVEKYLSELAMHHGVFVDIFPFDPAPDHSKERERYFKKARFLDQVYVSKFVSGTSTPQTGFSGRMKGLARKFLHIALRPVSAKKLYCRLDREIQRYNGRETACRCYALTPRLLIQNENLDNLDEILFEGKKLFCPGNLSVHLTDYFGDYMQLPPEEKRVGHQLEEVRLSE